MAHFNTIDEFYEKKSRYFWREFESVSCQDNRCSSNYATKSAQRAALLLCPISFTKVCCFVFHQNPISLLCLDLQRICPFCLVAI